MRTRSPEVKGAVLDSFQGEDTRTTENHSCEKVKRIVIRLTSLCMGCWENLIKVIDSLPISDPLEN